MSKLTRFCAISLLVLSMSALTFAGEMQGPGSPEPPPGAPGPPPGPPPNPLLVQHLNELFLLNFIGYLILVAAYWLGPRWLGRRRYWMLRVTRPFSIRATLRPS